ncbi:MAG: organic solvent transporter substrate-binding protein [Marmoricola sp.]|nr:organic solvent transporter substrate-binding protein [Marmoricola sp.]
MIGRLSVPARWVIGVTVFGLVSVLGLTFVKGGADQTTMYAYFTDASPLIKGNDVKMNGVKVGVIDSIKVDHGKAKVGIRLEKEALPVHTDARATVRPVGLLGERYVDLTRGTASAPVLPTGGALSTAHTGAATDLDQVLDTVDQPTGAALSALVTTLGEGLAGNGANTRNAIKALTPALQSTDELVGVLNDQSSVLTHLITSLEPLTGALATDRGRSLNKLVGTADSLLRVTAAKQPQLDQTLSELPSALVDAKATLHDLAGAAAATTPNLRAIRPTTDRLVDLSRELDTFSAAADPALKALDPVLVQGKALIQNALPVAESLRRAGPDLQGTVHSARPIAQHLLDNLSDVLDFVKYWALTTNGEDGLSHYFRAHLVITTEIATGLVPATKGGGSLSGLLGGLSGSGAASGGKKKGSLGGLLSGLLGGSKSSSSTTKAPGTGLTEKQENNLLSSLLGGL